MGNQQESLLSTPPETTVGCKMLKEIHTTKNYLVDTDGEIYNAKTLKKKAQFVDNHGYTYLATTLLHIDQIPSQRTR